MNNLFALWREPFPIGTMAKQTRFAMVLGLAIWLTLQVIQPFRLNEVVNPFFDIKLLGYGVITTVSLMLHTLLWRSVFPSMFQEKSWTIGTEISMIASNTLLIGLVNWLYSSVVFQIPITWGSLMFFQLATLSVGLVPTLVVTLLKYSVLMRRVLIESRSFNAEMTLENAIASLEHAQIEAVSLPSENKGEQLTLLPSEILAVESADNYVTVYFLKEGRLEKKMLRSSLQKIEEALSPFPGLERSHRSWIINLSHAGQASGNAQGLLLHVPAAELWVPVARSKINEIKSKRIQFLSTQSK